MQSIFLTIALAPLAAAIIAGLFGRSIGKIGAQSVTILGVGLSCVLSLYLLYEFVFDALQPYNGTVYTWLMSDGVKIACR
jgi:NADH-quinone oxidoreductase subunit L